MISALTFHTGPSTRTVIFFLCISVNHDKLRKLKSDSVLSPKKSNNAPQPAEKHKSQKNESRYNY